MDGSDLVRCTAQELRTSRLHVVRLVDTVLVGIARELHMECCVTLAGFGTFEVEPRKARVARNPRAGVLSTWKQTIESAFVSTKG